IIQGETGTTLDVTTGGTYAFTAFSSNGCESTIFFLVTVEAIPTVDLGADKTACEGEMVEIQLPDISDLEYEWSLDGNVLPGETSNSLEVATGGIYSATVTSQAGCSASDEVEVTFNTPPTYDLTDSASFCEGLTTDLELTTNAVNVTWLLNGNIQAQNINTLTVDEAGEYTVELSSAEGCTITAMTNVEVFSNPVLEIDDVDLCPGESQDIMVMTGYNSYTWDGINATGAEATINYQEFPQITTEQLSLTVVDQNSCSAMASFEVTYFPPINASVASTNVGICSGESATLQAFGGLFYEWNDPNGTLSADNISNPIASPSQTTTYEVTISDNCPNNIETLNVVVSVNDPPDAFAGLDTCIIIGTDFKLNASGGSTYSWDNSEFIIGSSNIPDPVIRIDSTTLFTVTVTDSNGCTDTDNIEICIIEDPLSLLDEVTILTPNGDGKNDELVFRGLEAFPENKLTIFNRWGGVIYEKVGYQRDGQRWSGLRDGIELPADTYYYILEFADLKLKTSLTIIRE
ncbi:MAG: gliding motility-associated C-terminal domain-containing protein, partial [Bacteroidia bacterium]|nr:gliding motility-associated C-terminal domain-containing protein [Bacteroidia bacterium]